MGSTFERLLRRAFSEEGEPMMPPVRIHPTAEEVRITVTPLMPSIHYLGAEEMQIAMLTNRIEEEQRRFQGLLGMSLGSRHWWMSAEEFRELEVARTTKTATLERPAAVTYVLPPVLPPDDYMALADRVGLVSAEVQQARVSRFLSEHGWPVYPYKSVMAYLTDLANRDAFSNVEVFWAPLRPKDTDTQRYMPGGWNAELAKPYERRVPGHALAKVEAMEAAIPGPLKFFVSDYAAVTPDPFLMVAAGGGEWVIDVWDEPGW